MILLMAQQRIGIFSGTFDPVHKGHIGFALEAIRQASLDEVYFLVEARPRRKSGVTHVAHRLAMLKLATKPYPKLKVLELPDGQFSVAKTLPRLKQRFAGSTLVFIAGSDMLKHMPRWPLVRRLFEDMELIVAVRANESSQTIMQQMAILPEAASKLQIIKSTVPHLSSSQLREALLKGQKATVLPSTAEYIKQHWLYVSVPPARYSH